MAFCCSEWLGGAQGMWRVLCWDWTNTATRTYTHMHSNPDKLWPAPLAQGASSTNFCRHASKAHRDELLLWGNNWGGQLAPEPSQRPEIPGFFIQVNLHQSEGDVKPSVLMYFCTYMRRFTRHRSAENPAQRKTHVELTIVFIYLL